MMGSRAVHHVRAIPVTLTRLLGYVAPRVAARICLALYAKRGMRIQGRPTFVSTRAWFDGSRNYSLITLHEGCTISRDVRVLTHDWSPHIALVALGWKPTRDINRLAPVEIGPFAFIGLGAILLPGAKVGRGAIVGAGTVVRGEVAPHTIVAGNPMAVLGDVDDYVARHYPDEWAATPAREASSSAGVRQLGGAQSESVTSPHEAT